MRSYLGFSFSTLATATLLVACGGGDSIVATTPTAVPATSPTTTTITGSAVKGPVDGATVTIKKASDGTVLTTTTTKAGSYSANVACNCDVIIEVNGGTYTDETTGATTQLTDPMKTVLTASGAAVTGIVTPLTTMAFTSSFPSATSAVSTTTFKQAASQLANQFNLTGVDITTATPDVSASTTDAYGKALRTVSQYLKDNNTTLGTITNQTLTTAQWSTFSGKYASSYTTATGQTVTYNIDGNTITSSVTGAGVGGQTVTTTTTPTGATVSGTGAGGGTGTCGVNVKGTVSTAGFSVPVDFSYCVEGIQAGSCDAGNQSLSQSVAGQQGLASAANLQYTYSASCAAGAFKIALQ